MIAGLGRKFFKLFQHPSLAIVKGAGLLMRTLIEESPDRILQEMQVRGGAHRVATRGGPTRTLMGLVGLDSVSSRAQSLALSEGAILKHLHTALFTQSSDVRMLTHRYLSRQLVTSNAP